MVMLAGILTLSDKGARGERVDESGPAIREMLASIGIETALIEIIPDETSILIEKLTKYCDKLHLDLIVTTGGTGFSPRDITPEATLKVIDKRVPGMEEAMRYESLKKTPHAMLSRAVCGIRKNSLIINLPGSPKAVKECLAVLMPALPHGLKKLKGDPEDCAQK